MPAAISLGRASPLELVDFVPDQQVELGHQVRRPQHQDALEARHVRGGCADEGLARAHLTDDGGAPVGFEGEGRAPYGVGLRPQGCAEQAGQLAPVLRGAVEGRVGLHHPLGDGVLEVVYEFAEVHAGVSFLVVAGGGRRQHRPCPSVRSTLGRSQGSSMGGCPRT